MSKELKNCSVFLLLVHTSRSLSAGDLSVQFVVSSKQRKENRCTARHTTFVCACWTCDITHFFFFNIYYALDIGTKEPTRVSEPGNKNKIIIKMQQRKRQRKDEQSRVQSKGWCKPSNAKRMKNASYSFDLPIVLIKVEVNASSLNLNKIHVFPTPESPISNNLNNKSYVFFAILR